VYLDDDVRGILDGHGVLEDRCMKVGAIVYWDAGGMLMSVVLDWIAGFVDGFW
jgi:hypothetical protein